MSYKFMLACNLNSAIVYLYLGESGEYPCTEFQTVAQAIQLRPDYSDQIHILYQWQADAAGGVFLLARIVEPLQFAEK